MWSNAISKWAWLLEEDDGKGGGNSGQTDAAAVAAAAAAAAGKTDEPTVEELLKDVPDAVKAHYGKLISQERKNGKTQAEAEAEAKRKTDADAAQIELDKKAGKFEEVETALKGQVTTTAEERDKLKARLDSVNEALKGRIEELKKGMSDIQLDGFPTEGDALDQITFLEARKAWLAKLGGGEQKKGTGTETPDRTKKTTGDVEQAELDRISKNSSYTI